MALTPEQIQAIRVKAGLPAQIPTTTSIQSENSNKQRVADFQARLAERRAATRKENETIPEKIGNFIGGTKIAQGLGQALALGKSSKDLDNIVKTQSKTQQDFIALKKKYQAEGKDTSKIDKLLENSTLDLKATASGAERLLNPNELTNKQVLGDALQLGTTAAGGKLAGAVASKVGKASSIGGGILKGGLSGAGTGAVIGASEGAAQGLKRDETASEIGDSALSGAEYGALTGGAIGAIGGGIAGGVNANKIRKQSIPVDAITPDIRRIPAEEYQELVSQGKIAPKTSTKPSHYIISDEEKAIAEKYKHILKTKDPVKNIEVIANEIESRDEEVGKFLRKNNGIYNTGELRNNIMNRLKNIDDLTVSEDRIIKAKNNIVDNFMKSLEKNDMETLWQARKKFDRQIENAFKGSPTLQKEMQKEFRNAVQEFIAEKTPDGIYKKAMKEMTDLFKLKDNVLDKSAYERKLGAIQKLMEEHPNKTKLLEILGAGIGLTVLGSAANAAIE